MKYIVFFSPIIVAGEDIVLPLRFELGKPQVMFEIRSFVNPRDQFPIYERSGFANFDTSTIEHPIIVSLPQVGVNHGFCIADADGRCTVQLEGTVSTFSRLTWQNYHHRVSGGFGSEFLNTVGTYMLTPSSLVIAPRNPRDYCFENSIAFVDPFEEGVGVKISLLPTTSSPEEDAYHALEELEIQRYSLESTYNSISIPMVPYMFDLVNMIREASSLQVMSGVEFLFIAAGCTEERITQFPSIRFTIFSGLNMAVNVILEPEEYVKRDEDDSCMIDIDWTADGSNRILGQMFFKQTTVMFDGRNHRFGFCEPL